MKTSFKAVRAALMAVFVFMVVFVAQAQRVKLLQLERYLGKPIPQRAGYVGLTDTLGDQYYHKLDSIIGHIADSIAEATDTDEQYFDSIAIVNDTLHFSIIRDGLPLHRISLKYLIDHDWYEVSSTSPPTNINQYKYSLGRITVGENEVYDQQFAVPLSDIRVREILIGYGGGALNSNMRAGKDALISNTTGIENMAIGLEALKVNNGDGNTGVGPHTLQANTEGIYNTAIGTNSLRYNIDGDFNTAIGYLSGFSNITGSNNTNIGLYSGLSNTSGMGNTNVGAGAGSDADGVSNNVNIGYQAGHENLEGENNTIIGTMAGMTGAGGGKVLIGFNAGMTDTFDNVLYIDNSDTSAPLIWGDFANDTVRINGSLQVTNRNGTPNQIAGWRNSDNKIVNVGIGDGIHLTDSIISSRDSQYFDVVNITDDTLNLSIIRDGLPTHRIDLKPYLDNDPENSDIQYFDTIYFADDTLYLSIIRDDLPVHKIYLGDLVSVADQDNQQHDTAFIAGNILYLSLQRDGINAHQIDLSPYLDDTDDQTVDQFQISGNVLSISLEDDGEAAHTVDLSPYIAQTYAHTGTTSYTNTLSLGGGTFTLSPLSGISIVHNGSGIVTFQNTGIVSFDINSVDDAYSATTIQSGNTIHFDGINGIVTSLAAPGSTTVRIDGSALIDHDWYEVGTTTPPNAITDEMFHTGKTGIGMNPTYLLDVAEDSRIYGHQIGRGGNSSITNIRFGKDALGVNIGSYNLAIGTESMFSNYAASYNTAIGYRTLYSNTSGDQNIAIGHEAMYNSTSGLYNLAIGIGSLRTTTNGYDNTALGHEAMFNSTGAQYNTAVGHASMYANKAGQENVSVGDYSIFEDTFPNRNIAIGRYSLNQAKNTYGNVAIGYLSFYTNSNAGSQYNTILGYEAMYTNASNDNDYNIGIGYRALNGLSGSGDENIAIGKFAGASLSGSNNTILGNDNTVTGGVDNNVIIGDGQTATSAGNIIIANGAGTLGIKMISTGLVGIGEATPTQKLHVTGSARVTGAFYDSNNDPGTSGQVLSSTVTGTDWIPAGSGGATDLTFSNASNPLLLSSTGSDVIFQDGTGIDVVYVNGFTVTFNATDASATNEIQSVQFAYGPGNSTVELSGSGSGATFSTGSGITFSGQSSTNVTINATDASVSNEGSLTVTGTATTALINSNTSGGSPVTLSEGTGIGLSNSGNTITISATNNGTVTSVALTGTTGIGVSGSPITTSGTFTLSLNNDLQALENIGTTGIAVRTGAATWTTRTLVSAGGINVSFGDGIGGNPTVSLQSITSLSTGFTNNTLVITDGSGTFGEGSFTSLATGLTNGTVMITDGSGTPGDATGVTYNAAGSGTLSMGQLTTSGAATIGGTINMNGSTVVMAAIPTYADNASASIAVGRVYKTSTGELRIKY